MAGRRNLLLLPRGDAELLLFGEDAHQRLFQTADLRQHAGALAVQTGDLSRCLALHRTSLLHGRRGILDLVRHVLERGGQIGLQALELAYAAFALEGAGGLRRHLANANDAAICHPRAVGCDIENSGHRGGSQGLSQGFNNIDMADERGDRGSEALLDL